MAVGDLTAARHLARGPQATCGWRPDIKPRNDRRMCARDWRCQLSGSDDASCPGALVNAAMWCPGHSEVLKEIRIARYRALPGPTCSTPGLGCSQGASLRNEGGHQSGIFWTEPTARTGDLISLNIRVLWNSLYAAMSMQSLSLRCASMITIIEGEDKS